MKGLALALLAVGCSVLATAQKKGFSISPRPAEKQVDIKYNGQLLTAYCYYDSVFKPFLFPVNTLDGVTVTRGYPITPRTGDRTDHPHHTGIWMNYESVNGLDFWNNSTAISGEKRNHYGTIRHDSISSANAGKSTAKLVTTAHWQRPDGHILLNEKTEFHFAVRENILVIDRVSTLTARELPVEFRDVKDGFIAIRVARELEMPSKEPGVFVDVHGNETKVPVDNQGVTGMYANNEGVKGDSVWSTKGRWTMLTGMKDAKPITIGLIDHPKNTGYPTYWHARGYGLFAANPLGRKVFSNGTDMLNFSLPPNQSVTFRYRFIIRSNKPSTPEEMNRWADDFASQY